MHLQELAEAETGRVERVNQLAEVLNAFVVVIFPTTQTFARKFVRFKRFVNRISSELA